MPKLQEALGSSSALFAPMIYRLALRLEQVTWREIVSSPSEAVFTLRSAQRLFKLGAVCASFDTWLEGEAAGALVERDDLGRIQAANVPGDLTVAPTAIPQYDPIANVVDVVRRLSADGGLPTVAGLTFGSTLVGRLAGPQKTSALLARAAGGATTTEDTELLEHAREIAIAVATAYLEAGVGALLLLHEDNDAGLPELGAFAAVFNLATYFDTPAILVCRQPVSTTGRAAILSAAPQFHVAPDLAGPSLSIITDAAEEGSGWFATTPWEVAPETEPATIHFWRDRTVAA